MPVRLGPSPDTGVVRMQVVTTIEARSQPLRLCRVAQERIHIELLHASRMAAECILGTERQPSTVSRASSANNWAASIGLTRWCAKPASRVC